MKRLSIIMTILLKRISSTELINEKISSIDINPNMLREIVLPYMNDYSDTEIRHLFYNLQDKLQKKRTFIMGKGDFFEGFNIFSVIFEFAREILTEQENDILCKYKDFLQWREVTSQIAEEIFVMAFVAEKDIKNGKYRKFLSYKPMITHNNLQLKTILSEGMSENHFHLKGSSPYFQLSWVQLMNRVDDVEMIKNIYQLEKRRRNVNVKYSKEFEETSFLNRIHQAALIRLYLYSRFSGRLLKFEEYMISGDKLELLFDKEKIEDISFDTTNLLNIKKTEYCIVVLKECLGKEYEQWKNKNDAIYRFIKNELEEKIDFSDYQIKEEKIGLCSILKYYIRKQKFFKLERCKDILNKKKYETLWQQETLNYVKYALQHPDFLFRHTENMQEIICVIRSLSEVSIKDYAISLSKYEWYEQRGRYLDLLGERVFLYECFRKIYEKGYLFSFYETNLFHAYLIIRESVRSEMVQTNSYVGFENFQVYERRKEYFSNGIEFEKSMARMAVRDTLQSQPIISLEARISPKNSAKQNYEVVRFLDNAIGSEKEYKEKFYYVFHFIKSNNEIWEDDGFVKCRSYQKRLEIKRKTRALIGFREIYPNVAERVLGIDAASQEIGCRPEVFAIFFRQLKQHTYTYGIRKEKRILPQLRVSYHVGEDFLDIVDGLRAIEEAILFLNLDCGDRLGHALALGIDVREWYKNKKSYITIQRQDYLDNIVWLYYALIKFRIPNTQNLKSYLEQQFFENFERIYGGRICKNELEKIAEIVCKEYQIMNMCAMAYKQDSDFYHMYQSKGDLFNFDIHTYYKAWELRGDDPFLYERGFYDRRKLELTGLDLYRINQEYPKDFTFRYIPEAAYLYYLYHFSSDVRKRGEEEVEYKVPAIIVDAIEKVQKAMQNHLVNRGIGIESNPSSNYMIGTFKNYAKHPIVNFYNIGLTVNEEKIKECPQICVSINTDDQGVFCSSLENEYALMARALEEERDDEGNHSYNKTMIYEWINNIRINGNRQSFKILKKESEN